MRRRSLRVIVVAAPIVAAFAWFMPSGAEQPEPAPATTVGSGPVGVALATPSPPRRVAPGAFPDLRTSERIAEYLERAPEPDAGARNPFRYGGRIARADGSPARRVARPAPAAAGENPPAAAAPEVFPLALIGVAEIEGASPHRVAILSSPAALFHAIDGETLLDRFTLGEITAVGVTVTDTVTGRQHLLALR